MQSRFHQYKTDIRAGTTKGLHDRVFDRDRDAITVTIRPIPVDACVGIRGLDRLLEDTLDPSRNVDNAFKATTLQLTDGRSPTGLVREEGAIYVLIDPLGKEQRIPAKEVDKVVKSNLSSMPANVDAIISEADYYHLMGYLLSQRPK